MPVRKKSSLSSGSCRHDAYEGSRACGIHEAGRPRPSGRAGGLASMTAGHVPVLRVPGLPRSAGSCLVCRPRSGAVVLRRKRTQRCPAVSVVAMVAGTTEVPWR